MKLNKKGFTLVELLAVIVILAVILVIAIPNVLSIIDKSRKDSMVNTAKMMVKAAQLVVAQGQTAAGTTVSTPVANKYITIKMSTLALDNVTKDPDGGAYPGTPAGANSYVVIFNDAGTLKYYVNIDGSNRDLPLAYSASISATSVTGTSTALPSGSITGASGTYTDLASGTYTLDTAY
jgi:type IV pilus assembly protein PilA